jgi:hypothetical protein
MKIEENSRDLSLGTNSIAVSETAKRQIAAEVLRSEAHLSGTKLGPSFFEGEFPETFPDGPAIS